MEEKKVLYKTKPNFNIIYEMFMPTGTKFRNTFLILILISVCYFFLGVAFEPIRLDLQNVKINENMGIDIYSIFNNVVLIILVVLALKFIIHLVIQVWQYNSIHYTFYEDYLEYEDTFLNQHKKTLMYDNIKEIEIKRTIWDRINHYGIIVIYTNAEKTSSNGLILYGIKDPQIVYDKIDQIVHKRTVHIEVVPTENENALKQENIQQESNDIIQRENEFKESLNKKN